MLLSDFLIRESRGVNIVIGFAHFMQPDVTDIVMETYSFGLCQTLNSIPITSPTCVEDATSKYGHYPP